MEESRQEQCNKWKDSPAEVIELLQRRAILSKLLLHFGPHVEDGAVGTNTNIIFSHERTMA